jgi:tetratricopeptide (TPR) repeat protein
MISIRNILLVLVLALLPAACKDYSDYDKRLADDLGKELMAKIEKGEYEEVGDYLNHLVKAKPYSNNGYRLLEEIYEYLSERRGKKDLWDAWCGHKEACHSAFIVRGGYHIKEAWRARGGDVARTVSDAWYILFMDELILAREDLNTAHRLNPKDPNSAALMIGVYMGLKMEEEEMEEWFQAAVKADPQSVFPYLYKLTFLSPKWRGSNEKFLGFADECAQNSPGGAVSYAVLHAYLREGAENTRDRKAFYNEPQIKALMDELFDRWLKDFPNSVVARIEQAAVQTDLGNWAGGIKYANEALKIEPENIRALSTRAWCYLRSNPGGHKAAEKDYQKILEISPYMDGANFCLAMIARNQKDYRKAIEFFDKAISLNDRKKSYFFERGRVKLFLGNHDEALNDMNTAITIDPEYEEAYWSRSVCLKKLNRIEEAEADSRKAEELSGRDKTRDLLAALSRGNLEQYIKSNRFIDLSALSQIPREMAERLSSHQGSLKLNGLETLDPEIAELFCKQKGDLHLDGLKSITPGVAKSLSRHEGSLYLNGLVEISPEVAASLGNIQSRVELNGLKAVSMDTASALGRSKIKGLSLNGMDEINQNIAKAFSEFRGELQMDGLKTISPSVAAILGKREGRIRLSGLKSLDPVSAKNLAKCKGSLILGGLEMISPETAAALSSHQGVLDLEGLKSLSPEVAEKLAACEGTLRLSGIERITAESAASLRTHKGKLDLGITEISPDVARELSRHQGKLLLFKLETADPEIRSILGQHKGGSPLRVRTSQ